MAQQGFPNGWRGHALQERQRWRELTYRQRLDWLEQAKQFCTQALGAARKQQSAAQTGLSSDETVLREAEAVACDD